MTEGVPHLQADEHPLHSDNLEVALDVRTWSMSGLGVYLQELLAGFDDIKAPLAWTMIGPESLRERMPSRLHIRRWIPFDAPIYNPRSFLKYPTLGDVDLFHYPHYNLPMTRVRRRVVTVFDLFHLRYGNWLRRRYQAFFLQRLRWNRAAIITACEKSAEELQTIGGIRKNRIQVIALGPGRQHEAPVTGGRPRAESVAGQTLRPPWLLMTGIDQPHKNFDFLLSAMSLYFQRRPDAPPLIWCGLSAENIEQRARNLSAHQRQRIGLEPFSTPERIEELYAGACGLIFPSMDEGFGLPPLEAMARDVPVLCSRREPMLSLLRDAPLYFEPTESASLWRVIDRLLDMPSVRREVIARGRACVARYDWRRCAQQTYETYLRVAQT